ncbi:potassium channel family protein [Actinotalea sp. K2]|uniref:potassium channel family protein n=1 Tax=Actinotalea sp. K2 TaxID=2939438 RepID=UPI002016E475|nr:potassium channel family protein [Actinotalea sp. K2]MCL3860767.1 potassium channel family protein [Actinotalea sp. K2]
MIGLLLQSVRLVRAVGRVFAEPAGRALVLLVATQLLSGTIFYVTVEGWRWLDALYFSVMVLTTIGLGDLAPQTDLGKAFTVVYALVGVGMLAAFVTVLAQHLGLGVPRHRRRRGEGTHDAEG